METFLRRTYLQNESPCGPRQYPVWDYRSRRGSRSASVTSGDGSSLSVASSRTEADMSESGCSFSSASGSDVDSLALRGPSRLTLDLLVDLHEVHPLLDLYEPLVAWVDPELQLFCVSERDLCDEGLPLPGTCFPKPILRNGPRSEDVGSLPNVYPAEHGALCRRDNSVDFSNIDRRTGCQNCRDGHRADLTGSVSGQLATQGGDDLPAMSVVVFLYEDDVSSGGRVACARRHLSQSAWKFHHCEQTSRRNLNLNPQAFDYHFISEDLPFLAVRQVHYGKEHIRVLVHTNFDTWADMVNFYRLLLGFKPDLVREDFCLFTVHSQINFDLQFALKRLDPSGAFTRAVPMQSVRLQFRVAELGRLVPLFPNVCRPISDTRWLTTDHDGNEVILEVGGHGLAGSASSSLSDRASCESCTSSDISFDSHDSGLSRGGSCSSSSRDCACPRTSSVDVFKRRKSGAGEERGRRRVTFCFDETPPSASTTSSPPSSPQQEHSRQLPAVSTPTPEVRFNLKFDTCPTAPGARNSKRVEQIGFYV